MDDRFRLKRKKNTMKMRIAILATCAITLALAQADAGGSKISDNESPRPTDRVFVKQQKANNPKNGIAVGDFNNDGKTKSSQTVPITNTRANKK